MALPDRNTERHSIYPYYSAHNNGCCTGPQTNMNGSIADTMIIKTEKKGKHLTETYIDIYNPIFKTLQKLYTR
jgi:hypothetical protein